MLLSSWSLYFRDTCITFPIFHHDLIANFNLMKQDPQENNIQLHIMNRYLYLQYSHTYLPYWVPNGYLILQNNKGNYFSRLKVFFFLLISLKKSFVHSVIITNITLKCFQFSLHTHAGFLDENPVYLLSYMVCCYKEQKKPCFSFTMSTSDKGNSLMPFNVFLKRGTLVIANLTENKMNQKTGGT